MNTGAISIDRNGRIHRELLLATFDKGLAKVIKQAVGEPGLEASKENAAR